MDEIEMKVERDADAGTWDINTGAAGPAGAARIDLSDGLTATVDLASPDAIGLLVTEEFETGQVPDDDVERVALVAGPEAAAQVAGRTVAVDPGASVESKALLSRLAVAVDGWRHARAELVRDLWSAEIVAAAAGADERLGIAALAAAHRRPGVAALREIAMRQEVPLDTAALEALGHLAGAIDVDLPTPQPVAHPVRRSVASDQVESARVHFGDPVDGRSRIGWMMLDPAVSSRRVFALEETAQVSWDEIDHLLRVRCRLSPRAYIPEVEAYWVRAYRSVTGTLLGLGQLDPFTGTDRTADGETYLGALSVDDWDGIVVDVTDRPEARAPGPVSRSARVAADFGRAALAAERLGLAAEASEAWRLCAGRWQLLGDDDRARNAEARAGSGPTGAVPYTADLIGTIRP